MSFTKNQVYNFQTSVYQRANQLILGEFIENNYCPLSLEKITESMNVTPGLMFAEGITPEEVVSRLSSWKLIQKMPNGKYIPKWWEGKNSQEKFEEYFLDNSKK